MRKKAIPEDIKQQVDAIVKNFNEQVIRDRNRFFSIRYKSDFLYLDRHYFGKVGPICRLKYGGDMENWGFAIFKYSSERYDPDEWLFPGSGHLNGTLEGALRAASEAYP